MRLGRYGNTRGVSSESTESSESESSTELRIVSFSGDSDISPNYSSPEKRPRDLIEDPAPILGVEECSVGGEAAWSSAARKRARDWLGQVRKDIERRKKIARARGRMSGEEYCAKVRQRQQAQRNGARSSSEHVPEEAAVTASKAVVNSADMSPRPSETPPPPWLSNDDVRLPSMTNGSAMNDAEDQHLSRPNRDWFGGIPCFYEAWYTANRPDFEMKFQEQRQKYLESKEKGRPEKYLESGPDDLERQRAANAADVAPGNGICPVPAKKRRIHREVAIGGPVPATVPRMEQSEYRGLVQTDCIQQHSRSGAETKERQIHREVAIGPVPATMGWLGGPVSFQRWLEHIEEQQALADMKLQPRAIGKFNMKLQPRAIGGANTPEVTPEVELLSINGGPAATPEESHMELEQLLSDEPELIEDPEDVKKRADAWYQQREKAREESRAKEAAFNRIVSFEDLEKLIE